jgi:hypothetical protein
VHDQPVLQVSDNCIPRPQGYLRTCCNLLLLLGLTSLHPLDLHLFDLLITFTAVTNDSYITVVPGVMPIES